MASEWTVSTEDDRVDLVWENAPNGPKPFWVRLKKELSTGEDRHIKTAGWKGISGVGKDDQEIRIDWKETGIVRAFTWLTDWSFTDDKDKKLVINIPTICALHTDVFELIENAITKRVEEADAKKKAMSGARELKPTSA